MPMGLPEGALSQLSPGDTRSVRGRAAPPAAVPSGHAPPRGMPAMVLVLPGVAWLLVSPPLRRCQPTP